MGRGILGLVTPATYTTVDPKYERVNGDRTHLKRRKGILEDHPDMRELFGKKYPLTAVYTILLVSSIYFGAYVLRDAPWWLIGLLGYTFGATLSHCCWAMIHDFTHYMGFHWKPLNNFFLCVADMPHIFAGAITFGELHRYHHGHLNECWDDPDLPVPLEDKIFGHTFIGKILWMLLFPLIMSLRQAFAMLYLIPTERKFRIFTKYHCWMAINWIMNISMNGIFTYYFGIKALAFVFISFLFGIGLHPLGGRWIAEHYATHPEQETYSYYGWANTLSFNIGFHMEHHDFPTVPWYYLPKITEKAPEYYKSLHGHRSYGKLLMAFLTDSNFTLRTRVARPSHKMYKLHPEKKAKYIKAFLSKHED